MKFNTKMPKQLKLAFEKELKEYYYLIEKKQFHNAWHHLERSHILGQSYPIEHTYSHWLMLKFGFKIKNIKEIFGQIPRLFFGGIKSFVGQIPIGNTGGANVPPLKPFPIEDELQDIFIKAGVSKVNKVV